MPIVLISDALSPAAVQIFKDRGIEVDFQPNLGKDKDKLAEMQARANRNLKVLEDWAAKTAWVDFLAADPAIRSNTSVCLKVGDPAVLKLPADAQAKFVKGIAAALEKEGIAYDIDAYRDAPSGLRIWCGATVERSDVEALTLWLDWAYAEAKAALPKAA